jgi:hypothetical protein
MLKKGYWKITVFSWGTLWGHGTEEEAKAWKAAKQSWEASGGNLETAKKADSPAWQNLRELLPHSWKPAALAQAPTRTGKGE